jgi:ubiquinone/menaquinone biosynthesis C-methylase UbiE
MTDPKRAPKEFRKLIPQLPSDEIQFSIHGKTGLVAVQEASDFVEVAEERYVSLSGGPLEDARVLDFGCGWGRIARLFLKDIKPTHLSGVNVRESIVTTAHELAPKLNFRKIEPFPPLPFIAASTIDMVVANSVFSHLSEEAVQQWIAEFARIIRPGGLRASRLGPEVSL